MMDNVLQFTGCTRLDIDPDVVLEKAKGKTEQILVLGSYEDGDLFVAASTANVGALLRLVETFKFKLMNGDFN